MKDALEYLWIEKGEVPGRSPEWRSKVQASRTCPDQRKYRRLTYRERQLYLDGR